MSDFRERLRLLTINDQHLVASGPGPASPSLDRRTAALGRLAALMASGGAVPSYGELVDDALGEGATADEIVDLLVAVIAVVGLPRVVAEAPKVALALGYDTDEAFEQRSGL